MQNTAWHILTGTVSKCQGKVSSIAAGSETDEELLSRMLEERARLVFCPALCHPIRVLVVTSMWKTRHPLPTVQREHLSNNTICIKEHTKVVIDWKCIEQGGIITGNLEIHEIHEIFALYRNIW